MGSILVWLLAGATVLSLVLLVLGTLVAALSRWALALSAAHVATVVSGIASILGLALLVALGLSARLGVGAELFASFASGADAGEKAAHLGQFISGLMNGTFAAGAVALVGTVLWMIAHRRLKRLATPAS